MTLNRRDFVKWVYALAGYGATTVPAGAAEPQSPGLVSPNERRDVDSLDPNGPIISAYRRAVTAMRQLDPSNPRSWQAQTRIHEDHCPHGNWYFLPWHRAYLKHFEQICREMSGDPNFYLPYWNWSTNPKIPSAFWGTSDNSLFHANRVIDASGEIAAESVGQSRINEIVGIADFNTFASGPPPTNASNPQRARGSTGQLESGPHNGVHGDIGGDMRTLMSPQDPIFWLHHCNVDRIWESWNMEFFNSDDPTWLNSELTEFFDPTTLRQVRPRVSELLSAEQSGYRYDLLEVGDPSTTPDVPRLAPPELIGARALAGWRFQNVASPNRRKARAVVKTAEELGRVDPNWYPRTVWRTQETRQGSPRGRSLARAGGYSLKRRLGSSAYLVIKRLPRPALGNALVRVFFNCDYLNASIDYSDPHYAGTVAFFGNGHHGSGRTVDLRLDVTNTLATLREMGVIDFSSNFPYAQLLVVDGSRRQMVAERLSGPSSVHLEFSDNEARLT